MRTGFSAWLSVAALVFLATPELRAADGGPAPGPAPTMQDYRDGDMPNGLSLPSSVPGPTLSGLPDSSAAPAPSIVKPENDNWLQKGVEAQRKAAEARQSGQAPDSPLKPVDPLAPARPQPAIKPMLQIDPTASGALKPAKGADGISPLVPLAPKPVDSNQFKPLIKGLSADATKPLTTVGGLSSTNSPSALSNFKAVEAVNPDVTRPLYLDSGLPNNSPALYGASSTTGNAYGAAQLPSGYDIPNAPSARPMGAPPIAAMAPLAPLSPQARPAGSSALSSFAPIQPISVPTAPQAPSAPTARDLAPKAGPGSAMKVRDPVGADLPFIR